MNQPLNYRKTHFITSAPDIRHLPQDSGVEIAFAGRSNAGKSSALNRITEQKSLARTSKTLWSYSANQHVRSGIRL